MSATSGLPSPARAKGIFETLVERPVGTGVAFATLMLLGWIAYTRIPLQMMPDGFRGTRLSVYVIHPGSSAAENEKKVARVIEEQFRTLPNLESVSSRSGEGSVMLGVSFTGRSDMALAKAELRDRIERARPQLPNSVDRIAVWSHQDGDLPVMFVALLFPERLPELDALIEHTVQRKIEAVDGVSRMQVWGMLDDSVRILLDEDRVKAARLDLGTLVRKLMQDNFTRPMGEITDGGRRFLLRSDMRFRSFEEIEDYPIRGDLRLRDVASVERVKTVRDRMTRIDGQDAYYGMIQKESTANVVEVSKGIRTALAELEDDPKLAGKLGVEVFFDQARFIETSLNQLQATASWGGGLAVLILLAFLRRVRMTLCVALSIPASALLALTWEYFTGGSFNVLTMTGLTLGVGMLVDNSVVVIESIARYRSKGQSERQAAVSGVRDVGLAISLATLTTVVVFAPLIFMSENPMMRTMLRALGVPLCVSLLLSLMIALIFLPVASARIMGEPRSGSTLLGRVVAPLMSVPVNALGALIAAARWVLHIALVCAHRLNRAVIRTLAVLRWPLVLALAAGAVMVYLRRPGLRDLGGRLRGLGVPTYPTDIAGAGTYVTLAIAGLGALLLLVAIPRWVSRPTLPPTPPAKLRPRGNSVLAWIQEGNRALLTWTLDHRLLAGAVALAILSTIVVPMGRMSLAAFGQEEDSAQIEIQIDMEDNFTLEETSEELAVYEAQLEGYREEMQFKHLISRFGRGGGELQLRWDERLDPERMKEYRARLRDDLNSRAGHELMFSSEQDMEVASRQYVHFQLRGSSSDALQRLGAEATELLRDVPGLDDVRSSLEDAPEEVRLSIDREEAYSYGVTSEMATQNLSWALRGAALPRFQEAGREIPFFIEYDDTHLAGLDTVRDLEVFTVQGAVPLTAFADLEFQPGQQRIFRWNGQTTFNIQARVNDPARQAQLVEAGYAALEELDLPRGFSLGRDQSAAARQVEEFNELRNALLLSVVLVFLLMGILLESLLLPISVLTTIPFAVLGAMWTVYLSGTAMDSVGLIGIIILVGVVVNNGIVLIDKIHRVRTGGVERRAAVLRGAGARVRPILMTALTTVFGLLPMALGSAPREGIDYRALATCVAGGLVASTFFTLWIVPWAYTVVDDLGVTLSTVFRRSLSRRWRGPSDPATGEPSRGSMAPSPSRD